MSCDFWIFRSFISFLKFICTYFIVSDAIVIISFIDNSLFIEMLYDFYMLILYPEALLNLLIRFFLVESLGFYRYKIMLSANSLTTPPHPHF